MLKARSKRVRPALDNKILTSWNALMMKGFADAYRIFGKQEYLVAARKNADFLIHNMMGPDGRLSHNFNPVKSPINGFLEDYCFLAEGLIAIYEVTFDENYLNKALLLAEYAISHFYNKENGLFFVTSDLDPSLFARKQEVFDIVMPSSNSSMARVLFLLGLAYEKEELSDISARMISSVSGQILKFPQSFANQHQSQ
jgi:uncharacterized protein YyaL (SSP411 family)